MGIPAVGNVHDLVNQVRDGGSLLVDGERGEVVVDPLPAQILGFGAARRCYEEANERACEGEAQECITTDGVRLSLLANIGRPTEVDQVRVHHLDGVGLFRTEYPFWTRQCRRISSVNATLTLPCSQSSTISRS